MATKDEWNPLVEQAANELAERWNIQKTAIPILAEMDKVTLTCNKQVHATSETIQKARKDTADTQTMIQSLREQDKALQLAFDRIDQLESIIQTVKDTYNKVAESVDTIEKAVAASHRPLNNFPISFGLPVRRSTAPVNQPYFPPPPIIDIYSTEALFSRESLQ